LISQRSFVDVRSDPDTWGCYVDSAVGAHSINQSRIEGFDLGYSRDGNSEVDFVIGFGKKGLGIEVRSCRRGELAGLKAFSKKFPKPKTMIVDRESLEKFLLTSPVMVFLIQASQSP